MDESICWVTDENTYDNGAENDKLLRNKGWMKAPDSYLSYHQATNNCTPARDWHEMMRKIAAKKYLVEGEHWIRFRFIGELWDWGIDSISNFLDYI